LQPEVHSMGLSARAAEIQTRRRKQAKLASAVEKQCHVRILDVFRFIVEEKTGPRTQD
jgi:hypothetical protein